MQRSAKRLRCWRNALAGVLAFLAGQAAAGDELPDAAKLSHLVRHDCGSCHGLNLKGGLGKPLTPATLARWDRDQIATIILDGIPGSPMPPWRPLLSKTDAYWIADALLRGDLR